MPEVPRWRRIMRWLLKAYVMAGADAALLAEAGASAGYPTAGYPTAGYPTAGYLRVDF
jgi:hypothetical protein